MINSSSDEGLQLVPTCDGSDNLCLQPAMEWTVNVISVISIVIIIVHLIILRRLEIMKGTPHLVISKAISISDAFIAFVNTTDRFCVVRKLLVAAHPGYTIMLSTISTAAVVSRYFLLAFAVLNQFSMLYFPFRYTSCVLYKKTGHALITLLIFAASFSVMQDITSMDSVCIHTLYGPSNEPANLTSSVAGIILLVITVFLPTATISIFSFLVLVELCKMRRRSLDGQQKDSFNATKHILTVVAVFIICLVPTYMNALMDLEGMPHQETALDWLSILGFTLYGLVNIASFSWRNKPYHCEFKQLVKSFYS